MAPMAVQKYEILDNDADEALWSPMHELFPKDRISRIVLALMSERDEFFEEDDFEGIAIAEYHNKPEYGEYLESEIIGTIEVEDVINSNFRSAVLEFIEKNYNNYFIYVSKGVADHCDLRR